MSKKILFCTLFFLIFLIPSKQDPNAKAWERYNTTVHADSIIAAIDRGEDIEIDHCEIFGLRMINKGTPERPDTTTSFISITNSTFHVPVYFHDCYFLSTVGFDGSTFNEMVSFWDATFYTDAWFQGTTFKKGANFYSSTFCENAHFLGVTFRDAYFTGTTFDGKVDLRRIEFEDIYILWKQLKGHVIGHLPDYFKLMENFEQRRQLGDADGVYLFLKDHERMEKRWYIRYPEYWLIQLTCGYGVKPWRPLITSALVIILFTFIYLILDSQEKEPLNLGLANPGSQTFKRRPSRGFYYSINTFIIGAPPNWTVGNGHSQKWFRIWTTIERALGWILLVLFVVTLTRKFIR
jgi:hypothetical protein